MKRRNKKCGETKGAEEQRSGETKGAEKKRRR